VCCQSKDVCHTNDLSWVPAVARRIEGEALTISLTVVDSCVSKPINGLRYLWKETPCEFKEAAIYSGEDPDLPGPPYIHYF
jgi:sialate O-acetylesterase